MAELPSNLKPLLEAKQTLQARLLAEGAPLSSCIANLAGETLHVYLHWDWELPRKQGPFRVHKFVLSDGTNAASS